MTASRLFLTLFSTCLLLSPGTAAAQDIAPTRARIITRIGEGATQEHAFGKITGLAIDPAGVLYVSDAQDDQIAVFDASGKQLSTIGRKGNGPGEFHYPTSLAIAADGSLWVRDQQRVQRFTKPAGATAATKFASIVGSVPMADWMSMRSGVVDDNGRFYVPKSYVVTKTTPPTHMQMMQRLDVTGRVIDSIMPPTYPDQPPAWASYQVSANSGRMLKGLNFVPFAPVETWTATPRGTIVSGDQRTYSITETDLAGKVVRRFSRQVAPTTIPAKERNDSLRALSARFDSIPVPLTQVNGMPDDVRAKRLPGTFPFYRELIVSSEGMLWVRRWPSSAEGATSRFDVFTSDARFVGTVLVDAQLAPAPSLTVSGAHAAGVQVDPDTGLEQIVRFEVPPAMRGPSVRKP